jgi:molecular chaperone GrpE (heat shock protein)
MTTDEWGRFGGPATTSGGSGPAVAAEPGGQIEERPSAVDEVFDVEASDAAFRRDDGCSPAPSTSDATTSQAPGQPSDAAPPAAAGIGQLQPVLDALAELRADVQQVAGVAEHQRTLVDKLHAENERLRRAEMDRARDPFVRDLIGLRDTCLRTARRWEERDDAASGRVAEVLRGVSDDVQLILGRQGVDSFEPTIGAAYDRREQRVTRSLSTGDADGADVVAEVLRPGYRIGDRVVRHADVAVLRYSPQERPGSEPPAAAAAPVDVERDGQGTPEPARVEEQA